MADPSQTVFRSQLAQWLRGLTAARRRGAAGGGRRHPELAEAAGGVCVTGDASGHVETLSLPALAAAAPDVIIFGPCGFHMARSVKEMKEAAWLRSPGAPASMLRRQRQHSLRRSP